MNAEFVLGMPVLDRAIPQFMKFNFKKSIKLIAMILVLFCLFSFFEIYIPKSKDISPVIVYTAKKGMGDEDIARDLEQQGIIKNNWFFRLYVVILGNHSKLQAGSYNLSSSMSIADIVKKFILGDVIKENIIIIEGWDIQDIGKYLESKSFCSQEYFLSLTKNDWSQNFDILKDKPKNLNLEGYIFPDTYQVYLGQTPEELLKNILNNLSKKLTPELRNEIVSQKKSVFGILWKRLVNDMSLQIDSTINYITNKSEARVAIKDTKIDSPYNTYKYQGLPLGPISNPGIDSILAAIYPIESPYWYYLSASTTGKTIFSKTLLEHNQAVAKYLK